MTSHGWFLRHFVPILEKYPVEVLGIRGFNAAKSMIYIGGVVMLYLICCLFLGYWRAAYYYHLVQYETGTCYLRQRNPLCPQEPWQVSNNLEILWVNLKLLKLIFIYEYIIHIDYIYYKKSNYRQLKII